MLFTIRQIATRFRQRLAQKSPSHRTARQQRARLGLEGGIGFTVDKKAADKLFNVVK